MSWDQEYKVESINSFLQRLVGIEPDFVEKEVRRRMEEKGLTMVNVEQFEGMDEYMPYKLFRVTLNDGRTFIHRRVYSVSSDDWGRDEYELRDEKEKTVCEKKSLDDYDNDWMGEP